MSKKVRGGERRMFIQEKESIADGFGEFATSEMQRDRKGWFFVNKLYLLLLVLLQLHVNRKSLPFLGNATPDPLPITQHSCQEEIESSCECAIKVLTG